MLFSRLGISVAFAAFMMVLPGAQAQSVADKADEAEITAMDLEKAGNLDGAVAKHREAIKLLEPIAKYAKKVATFKENFEITLLNAANAKFNAKDQAGAAALLEEALALDPAGKNALTKKVKESLAAVKSTSLNQEGVDLLKAGNAAAAVEKFKQVLDLDPTNKAARVNCDVAEAQVALAAGDPATALVKMQDAVNLEPSRQFLQDGLAKIKEAAEAKAAADAKKAEEEAKKQKK
jgi:tetratricopeptide (TPR) repeat protein